MNEFFNGPKDVFGAFLGDVPDKVAAPSGNKTQLTWWENVPEIQKAKQWVDSQNCWGFDVQWEGYAGSDSTIQVVPVAKPPATVKEFAASMGEKAHYIAAAAEDGYYSIIEKQDLSRLLEMMATNPDIDPSEFQADDAFLRHDLHELPDFDQLYELHNDIDAGTPDPEGEDEI